MSQLIGAADTITSVYVKIFSNRWGTFIDVRFG
jgi:hypothetical protein